MVAEDEEVTEPVVTAKFMVLLPAPTVTDVGTVAEALLLESATMTPPEGAGPLRVTVPVAGVPPVTLVGLTESEESVTFGFDVNDKVTVEFAAMTTLS
jgi:hypothetical protein